MARMNRDESDKNDEAEIWGDAERALIAGDVSGLERLMHGKERLFREELPPAGIGGLRPDYSAGGAREVLLRNHQFKNWDDFARNERFEATVNAVVAGDEQTLAGLLGDEPELVRARSLRLHRATLLHYVGANGVEYFRQMTPPNVVRIAEMLIQAGAEVGAQAEIYGRSTALGLAVTSVHPVRAGVAERLVLTLLEHGATPDGATVNSCLANGRPEGAELLARHGAELDLEGAAGVGRLDVVQSLIDGATEEQKVSGFQWACEYGRVGVVEFLLRSGLPVNVTGRPHGQTGLHFAAFGGQVEVVRLLLEHGAATDLRDDRWQSTALGWAMYRLSEASGERGRYCEIAAELVRAGSFVEPEMRAALSSAGIES